jgi:hypothetical protein
VSAELHSRVLMTKLGKCEIDCQLPWSRTGIAASRGQIIDELLQRFVLFPIAASQWCATTRTIVVILQPLCDTLNTIIINTIKIKYLKATSLLVTILGEQEHV